MSFINNEVGDFFSDLQDQHDRHSCGEKLIEFYSTHGALASHVSTGFELVDTVASDYNSEWRQYVYESGMSHKHHAYYAARQSMNPVFWGVEVNGAMSKSNSISRHLENSAYDIFGARSSIVFPVHMNRGATKGCASYVTNMKISEFRAYINEYLAPLQSAAILAFTRVMSLDKENLSPTSKLAPRELECVKWLVSGKRTQQIADKLNIRDVTVNLYIQNAKKKLQANTREQLVAKSLIEGHVSF